jgi:hypothetical protein
MSTKIREDWKRWYVEEKKRMWEKAKLEELSKRKETRQLYLKTGQPKKGFQPRTSFCKNKNEDFIGDNEGVLKRWAEYFREPNGKEQLIEEDEDEYFGPDPEIKEPSLLEIEETIKELENNKAPGEDNITAELLKCGAHLWRMTPELITEIWRTEIMPGMVSSCDLPNI